MIKNFIYLQQMYIPFFTSTLKALLSICLSESSSEQGESESRKEHQEVERY